MKRKYLTIFGSIAAAFASQYSAAAISSPFVVAPQISKSNIAKTHSNDEG